MARFSAGGRSTIAATSSLPLASLYATAAVRPRIVEVGIFNTTSTAFVAALQRLSTTGTQGTAISVIPVFDVEQSATATPKNGHTVGPTITSGVIKQASLGAAVGAGVIWTWPDSSPLEIAAATTNGVGITCPTGTGQIVDFYIDWLE